MKIRILTSAFEDLFNARIFYEKQGEGLGDYFFESLSSDIDSLNLYAGIHPRLYGYYRMLAKRFPYAIYYEITGDEAIVWRVLDLRQDPDQIKLFLS